MLRDREPAKDGRRKGDTEFLRLTSGCHKLLAALLTQLAAWHVLACAALTTSRALLCRAG